MFVSCKIEFANKRREMYQKLGLPSQQQFEDVIANNLIINCPVTADNSKRALLIYGTDIATLKGKNTCGKAILHIPIFVAAPIPTSYPHL
jgi:hypothetical protein